MANVRQYHTPETLTDALQLMADHSRNYAILAGGTQLVGELETGQAPGLDGVIDLRQLGLDEISIEQDKLKIGAMVTLSDIVAYKTARDLADGLLLRAARGEGPINLRNAATVGGIVATAAPDSEFYAALLALDATIMIAGLSGSVMALPLAEFTKVDGLITDVIVPIDNVQSGLARVTRTPSDRPIVAAVAVIDDTGERVALCGVADRPMLDGSQSDPPDDFKGSAEYRNKMAVIVTERALKEARG